MPCAQQHTHTTKQQPHTHQQTLRRSAHQQTRKGIDPLTGNQTLFYSTTSLYIHLTYCPDRLKHSDLWTTDLFMWDSCQRVSIWTEMSDSSVFLTFHWQHRELESHMQASNPSTALSLSFPWTAGVKNTELFSFHNLTVIWWFIFNWHFLSYSLVMVIRKQSWQNLFIKKWDIIYCRKYRCLIDKNIVEELIYCSSWIQNAKLILYTDSVYAKWNSYSICLFQQWWLWLTVNENTTSVPHTIWTLHCV